MKKTTRSYAMMVVLAGMTPTLWSETKVTQEVVVGGQSVKQNNPEAKFEEYKEIPNGLLLEKYSMDVDSKNSDLSIEANNVFQDHQSASVGFSTKKLDLGLSYDQTPHRWSNTAMTIFSEESPGVFRLPDDLQSGLQSYLTASDTVNRTRWYNTMISSFPTLARTQELETRQDKTAFSLGYSITNQLGLKLGLFHEKKDGHKLQAFALGRNYAVELPKTVDQVVYGSNIGISFVSKSANAAVGYDLSVYNNKVETLTWDNSKRITDRTSGSSAEGNNSAQGQASLQPDNIAHTASFNGGVDLPLKSRLNADVSYVWMFQNDDLLPYTINSSMTVTGTTPALKANDSSILPYKSAQASQNLVVQNYSLQNKILHGLNVEVRARSEQLGSHSKEMQFRGHAYVDQTWTSGATSSSDTAHMAYRKMLYGGRADYMVSRPLTVGAEYTYEDAIREHREYRETKEQTIIGRVLFRPLSRLSIRGEYTNANRTPSEFEISDYKSATGSYLELPGLRRFDLAERNRNAGELTIQSWVGPINLALNGAMTHDKFGSGEGDLSAPGVAVSTSNQIMSYGLLENRNARAGIDLDFDFGLFGVFTYYQFEQVKGVQRSNTSGGGAANQDTANDWTVVSRDRYDVVGLGADVDVTEKATVSLGYDLSYSRGATDLKDLGSAHTGKASPPETKTSKQDYSIKGSYKVFQGFSLEAGYLFEKYDVTDFATDNIPYIPNPSSSNQTNIFLGDSIMDYKAHVITLLAKYKF